MQSLSDKLCKTNWLRVVPLSKISPDLRFVFNRFVEAEIAHALHVRFDRVARSLLERSNRISVFLNCRMEMVALAWLAVFTLAALPRILAPETPIDGVAQWVWHILPYALIALAPVVGFLIAAASFPLGTMIRQPEIRLSLYGKWRRVSILEARSNPAFGPRGFLVSLLVGLLLNVVVRSLEFLAAMPAMGAHAPEWGYRLFGAMVADVVIMNFFYMVCFVMALRSIPFFPRMLLLAWGVDIMMQLIVWTHASKIRDVPPQVLLVLEDLISANMTKVMISMVVWLPYLILSDRVNVTYRQRIAA